MGTLALDGGLSTSTLEATRCKLSKAKRCGITEHARLNPASSMQRIRDRHARPFKQVFAHHSFGRSALADTPPSESSCDVSGPALGISREHMYTCPLASGGSLDL